MPWLNRYKVLIADGALVLIALFWGVGFVAMKDALVSFSPFWLLALRFTASFILMAIIFKKRLRKLTAANLKAGLLIGVFLFLGFATQTIGLAFTSPGKQAFITATYVVIVPFLSWGLKKIFPGYLSFVASLICLAGMALLTLQGNGDTLSTFNKGDLLTFACAIFFACHILAIEMFASKMDPLVLATLQIGTTALLSFACALLFEEWPGSIASSAWWSIAFTVLFCTVFALSIQNAAQKFTPSTHAAILLSLESVFGALSSVLILGEVFTIPMVLGCFLILIAVLLTETGPTLLGKLQIIKTIFYL
ncbi:DMT family transporter [Aminobacterium colombiense]|jgi:drug/metabolite transporter (DMT)-like permease